MTGEPKGTSPEAVQARSHGISPWWLFLLVAMVVVAGWLGWQAIALNQEVSRLQEEVTQLQDEAGRLRTQAGAAGEQKTALAAELAPVIEEWAKIAQVQVETGNTAGAQASVERAEKFLTMAEGLGSDVSLDAVKAAVDQVKATLVGEAPKEGGTGAAPEGGAAR
jgi:hypothetical protein